MSSREKKLLAILIFAGFLILNFLLFAFYNQKKSLGITNFNAAKAKLQQAIALSESSKQIDEEIEWLSNYEPQPAAYQDAQTKLQQFAQAQALGLGLIIKNQELLPTDESGVHYHRAQVKLNLSGNEEALYRWFDIINDPTALRTTYQILMTPNSKDDTTVDCAATLAQWFIPAQ